MDADFLFMKCIKCNEQFFEPELFKSHMREVHLVADGINAPHGIMHKGLSLVVYPEEPGIDAANVSLLETKQADFLRLAEVVINEHGGNYSVSRAPMKLKEPEDEHGCGPNEKWDGQQCVPIESDTAEEQDEHGCAPDERWDGEKCVKKAAEQTEDHGCKENQVWNPVSKKCEPIIDILKEGKLDEIFVKGTKTQLKKIYEKTLALADKNYIEYRDRIEPLVRQDIFFIKEMLKQMKPLLDKIGSEEKTENHQLKETTDKLTAIEIRLDNLEAKQRGQFKGHNKNVEPKHEPIGRPSYREQSRK